MPPPAPAISSNGVVNGASFQPGVTASGLCLGCFRTLSEIGGWRGFTDARRAEIMAQLLHCARGSIRKSFRYSE